MHYSTHTSTLNYIHERKVLVGILLDSEHCTASLHVFYLKQKWHHRFLSAPATGTILQSRSMQVTFNLRRPCLQYRLLIGNLVLHVAVARGLWFSLRFAKPYINIMQGDQRAYQCSL
jgi:hypothetical protein